MALAGDRKMAGALLVFLITSVLSDGIEGTGYPVKKSIEGGSRSEKEKVR